MYSTSLRNVCSVHRNRNLVTLFVEKCRIIIRNSVNWRRRRRVFFRRSTFDVRRLAFGVRRSTFGLRRSFGVWRPQLPCFDFRHSVGVLVAGMDDTHAVAAQCKRRVSHLRVVLGNSTKHSRSTRTRGHDRSTRQTWQPDPCIHRWGDNFGASVFGHGNERNCVVNMTNAGI